MQRIITRFLGLVLVAVVGLFAYTGGSGSDTLETGGLTPLAPQGLTEPDLSDPVLFIDGEPVTGIDGDTAWVLNSGGPNQQEVAGPSPIAPPGLPEADVSDSVMFIEGEPVTPFNGDKAFDLPELDSRN